MVVLALFAAPAMAWNRSPATQFAALPAGTAHPKGITADARGNFYVANFDVSGNTAAIDASIRLPSLATRCRCIRTACPR